MSAIEASSRLKDPIDDEIVSCLSGEPPKCFFLFAGAGSGKTRALVAALNYLRHSHGPQMRLRGQQIAVITYTNAACDEIKRRLDFDPLIAVSTIHSFVWDLIRGLNADIRDWLKASLTVEIGELQEQQRTGRAGTKAAAERERSIEAKQRRLTCLDSIKTFIYNPNGDNTERESLNHAEVIKIGADFLTNKRLMQELLICHCPILLIDESQDTNRLLMEAFFAVQASQRGRFRMGLFGDTMQRIYSDGKIDLGRNLPSDWATPTILVNHRCPRRIVRLINTVRSAVDDHQQNCRPDAAEGFARLYLAASNKHDKRKIEAEVAAMMANSTSDPLWTDPQQVKTLTLEHHMAARRMGFSDLFEPLYAIGSLRTGLLDGTLPAVRFFSELVMPLVDAASRQDNFAVAAIVRRSSPLLSKDVLREAGIDQAAQLKAAKQAVDKLMKLWVNGGPPKFIRVLECVCQHKLFPVPESLDRFALSETEKAKISDPKAEEEPDETTDEVVGAIRRFLEAPFDQIKPFSKYVKAEAPFDTHQGVKGLEFPRVLVIMDDEEARGFLFRYGKLLGDKDKTKTDVENERSGKETSMDRTRRLFYVTCSRAKESLAIVAYSSDPAKIRNHALEQGWFDADEIEILE